LQVERRAAILRKEEEKDAELEKKTVQVDDARFEKQQNRLLQHAASRGRVEACMSETKAKMAHLHAAMEERYAKVTDFELQKEQHLNSAHQMAVRTGLYKQSMHFSMGRMRNEAVKPKTAVRLEVPAHIRGNIQNPELKALLDRMDADATGRISLTSMRSVLSQDAELDKPKPKRGMRHAASTPNLSAPKPQTEEEKLIAAFKDADRDNSGSISKREMFDLLQNLGIDRHSSRMKLFRGFDVDDDGVITFDEFKKIAAAL